MSIYFVFSDLDISICTRANEGKDDDMYTQRLFPPEVNHFTWRTAARGHLLLGTVLLVTTEYQLDNMGDHTQAENQRTPQFTASGFSCPMIGGASLCKGRLSTTTVFSGGVSD